MSKSHTMARISDDLSEIKDCADLVFMATKGMADATDSRSMGLGLIHLLYLVERLQERVEDAR